MIPLRHVLSPHPHMKVMSIRNRPSNLRYHINRCDPLVDLGGEVPFLGHGLRGVDVEPRVGGGGGGQELGEHEGRIDLWVEA